MGGVSIVVVTAAASAIETDREILDRSLSIIGCTDSKKTIAGERVFLARYNLQPARRNTTGKIPIKSYPVHVTARRRNVVL